MHRLRIRHKRRGRQKWLWPLRIPQAKPQRWLRTSWLKSLSLNPVASSAALPNCALRQHTTSPCCWARLRHGDCLDVLAADRNQYDLILADPPYGVKRDTEWDGKNPADIVPADSAQDAAGVGPMHGGGLSRLPSWAEGRGAGPRRLHVRRMKMQWWPQFPGLLFGLASDGFGTFLEGLEEISK